MWNIPNIFCHCKELLTVRNFVLWLFAKTRQVPQQNAPGRLATPLPQPSDVVEPGWCYEGLCMGAAALGKRLDGRIVLWCAGIRETHKGLPPSSAQPWLPPFPASRAADSCKQDLSPSFQGVSAAHAASAEVISLTCPSRGQRFGDSDWRSRARAGGA